MIDKRYLVITNSEGGARYKEYKSPEDIFDSWLWLEDYKKEEIKNAEFGDEVTLDGCSDLFILKE